jgi:hypothetical protein
LDNQLIITENKAISDIPERSRTKYKNSRRPLLQKDRLLVHLAIHSRATNKDVVTHHHTPQNLPDNRPNKKSRRVLEMR